MTTPSNTSKINDKINFHLSDSGRIDSKKYTLYEVLIDPRLDKLSLEERLAIFNSFYEDADRNNFISSRRYVVNSSAVERNIFDPSINQVVRVVNFGSNDYLNMSQHPRVINAAIQALETYGAGSGASCITTGRTKVKTDLEEEIAETFGREKALVYPAGFMTNTGVLSGLLRSNDIAIVDMLAHASIMDGVESRNKIFFRHNDMRSLESAITKSSSQYANKIVVVDGVYSMDGDIANLPEISGLCKKYNCKLMVDEAHAFGVIGKNGLGITDHFSMPPNSIDILVGTLSKAIGSAGGFVTGNKDLINYLRFASRPYFFTTAPFIPAMAAALESIRIIKSDEQRRKNLWTNIGYFKSKVLGGGFNIGPAETAIFPIILGNHNHVIKAAQIMGSNGVLVLGVAYPAVSKKQTRIRMNVSSEMIQGQLDKGYDELCNAIRQVKLEELANTTA
ncbi:MAG: pyridoxal phosphate-dependent aminotransferase family protein [Saprospiraceae bacterium]|nr:pyridoxal phosphate-dependent aminotransferase family protein [Saprospiraceae bacterium]